MNEKLNIEKGDRVKVKQGQPWAGEYGTYVCDEATPVGILMKIKLDNGFSFLTTEDKIMWKIENK